jgi:hypothetical protein
MHSVKKTGKALEVVCFPLKKRIQNNVMQLVLRYLANLCHRPAHRFGLRRDRRGSRLRDPRFVSFLAQTNRRTLDPDFHDTLLRGRKLFRRLLMLGSAAGATWFLLESAKALSIF